MVDPRNPLSGLLSDINAYHEIFQILNLLVFGYKTRPDTRLPKSRAGGQGPYLRSLGHLGRSSEVKEMIS